MGDAVAEANEPSGGLGHGTAAAQDGPPDLAPGDLIFFRNGSGIQVGFFIGDFEFASYSTWRGAMIDRLDDPALRTQFVRAQRVIQ